MHEQRVTVPEEKLRKRQSSVDITAYQAYSGSVLSRHFSGEGDAQGEFSADVCI
jgi:hypothetical protein